MVSKNLGNGRELRLAQLNIRRSQYVTLEIVRVMEDEDIYLANGGVSQSKREVYQVQSTHTYNNWGWVGHHGHGWHRCQESDDYDH